LNPATPCMHSLSLHDALPISIVALPLVGRQHQPRKAFLAHRPLQLHTKHLLPPRPGHLTVKLHPSSLVVTLIVMAWGNIRPKSKDRKSTRLNSSHVNTSYAVS